MLFEIMHNPRCKGRAIGRHATLGCNDLVGFGSEIVRVKKMRQIIPTSHFRLQLAYKQKKERQKEALQRMVHGVGMIGVDQT